MRTKNLLGVIIIIGVAVTGFQPVTLNAQTESALVLSSVDPTIPVQFQRLEPGDFPASGAFSDRLEIEFNPDKPLVYVILQNTGWSEGTIGLASSMLSPSESYVALEVLPDGNRYTLRDGGLAFELGYLDNSEGSDDSNFQTYILNVLISEMHTFAIYRIAADSEGVFFNGFTNMRSSASVVASPVQYKVDPHPVFDRIVLDCHIVALIAPPDGPPTPYTARRVYADTGIHCQVIDNATNRAVLTTWAQYTTYNTVKACEFSADWQKFGAAYHYGHRGNYTWIGVWSTSTGAFLYSREEPGWIYSAAAGF